MIKKLLIANRGEIVCRIGRTCRRLGIPVATIHSAADRDALHVRTIGESIEVGAAPSAQSYLNIDAIVRAALQVGADAVHPGIGFLSEDPNFASAVEQAGMIFVGPSPDILRRFGDKWAAKREARLASVPVIEGGEGSSDDPRVIEHMIRSTMRLPVVLKAAAGGGGRGVRIVRELAGLSDAIESAMREARSSFGRADLIVEEFVQSAQHIEVQIAGDGSGNAIHLFERECSLQRRFQKIIEEAPAEKLSPSMRARIVEDAVRLARSVNYKNLGTVEFLVSGDSHYFLECNPRLQVEHTVTEAITGLDLVELQLRIAATGVLPLQQDQVHIKGHAIQLRLYAEDAAAGFVPSTGTLTSVSFPTHARIETGVETGSEISSYYDPMIAKLIFHGDNRDQTIGLALAGLAETVVAGVETNLNFLRQLLLHPVVRSGTADNRFIDREMENLAAGSAPAPAMTNLAIAASIVWANREVDPNLGLWSGAQLGGAAYSDGTALADGPPVCLLVDAADTTWPIRIENRSGLDATFYVGDTSLPIRTTKLGAQQYMVFFDNQALLVDATLTPESVRIQGVFGSCAYRVLPFLSLDDAASAHDNQLVAPMMGTILKINVCVGDTVKKFQQLIVEESMKMELALDAPYDAKVVKIMVVAGDIVERDQILIELEEITGDEK